MIFKTTVDYKQHIFISEAMFLIRYTYIDSSEKGYLCSACNIKVKMDTNSKIIAT